MNEQIIHFLRKSDSYISGEDLSGQLKVSRAAVWKNIQELRNCGYEIIAVPHLGYKLVSSPDKILPHEIQFQLGTKMLGKKVSYYDSLPSTMDEAFKLGMQGAPEGTVVCCETQTKGRGRLGRQWSSPKFKGIYASIILRPQCPPGEAAQLTLLTAVAVCDSVRKMSSVKAMIKWPNDILVDNKKLAGILTELNAEMDRVRFVVIGIGLNVNTPLSFLPLNSTSLKQETGKNYSRVALFQEILRALERRYFDLKTEGFPPVIADWKKLSSTLGKRVRISDPAGIIEGEAVNLDETGALMVRGDSGIIIRKISGDVVQVR